MPTITVRLSQETSDLFKVYCGRLKMKQSTTIREWIEMTVSKMTPIDAHDTVNDVEDADKVRVDCFITESEYKAIRIRVNRYGGTRARWIISAIRAALTQEPTFSDNELESLNKMNYELNGLNKNLRDLVNSIENGETEVDQSLVEHLTLQVNQIKNRTQVSVDSTQRVIDSSRQRWAIKS